MTFSCVQRYIHETQEAAKYHLARKMVLNQVLTVNTDVKNPLSILMSKHDKVPEPPSNHSFVSIYAFQPILTKLAVRVTTGSVAITALLKTHSTRGAFNNASNKGACTMFLIHFS